MVSGRTWHDNPFYMAEFMRMLKASAPSAAPDNP